MSDSAGVSASATGGASTGSSATPASGAGVAATNTSANSSGSSRATTSSRQHGDMSSTNQNHTTQTTHETQGQDAGDDFEEIALGSVKGKVPKSLAKAIKDFERGAQTRMEEAARFRKEASEKAKLLEMLKTNPDEVAKHLGIDFDSFAEERLAKKYELLAMSPEQRELHEAREQIERHKQAELQSKSSVIEEIKNLMGADAPTELEKYPKEQLQAYAQQQRQVYEQTQASLNQEIIEAWKESGLPKHKYFGSLMSFAMLSHIQQNKGQENFQPLHAKEAAAKVKTDFMRSVQEIVSQMDPQGIQELLGKDVLTKLRTFDIDRVTAKAASTVGQPRPGFQPASEQGQKKYVSQSEWRKLMGLG